MVIYRANDVCQSVCDCTRPRYSSAIRFDHHRRRRSGESGSEALAAIVSSLEQMISSPPPPALDALRQMIVFEW